MAVERTLSIIKPDAVAQGVAGKIVSRFEEEGLAIVALKKLRLTRAEAEGFYAVHRGKPFFQSLTEFMTSGPLIVMILEGEEAIARNRAIMGATDSQKAAPGTLRNLYGTNIERNAVHGSDAVETAAFETAYFFSALEIVA